VTATVAFDAVDVGTTIPTREFAIQRSDLIRYCGVSGDFNIIHWNDRAATAVGLPGVIAHGMFTMATAIRIVTDWVGDPGAVQDYRVRFSSMVPVPDDSVGATVTAGGVVEKKLHDNRVVVGLTVRHGDAKVLLAAKATVALA
jgi:acyl dehydratase